MKILHDAAIEAYAVGHTQPEPEYLQSLVARTEAEMEHPHWLIGRMVGRFLKLLIQIQGPRRVVEVGTFTGYSALWMAEGLSGEGRLMTCEIDPKARRIAQSAFDASPFGRRIEIRFGPALETLRSLEPPIDFAFVDADKEGYPAYYEEILSRMPSGGILVLDNMFRSGDVLAPRDPDAAALAALNDIIVRDERVDNVLLTVRDGLQLVRKR